MNPSSSQENNYKDQFLYIAEYLENNPEDLMLVQNGIIRRFKAQKYFNAYLELIDYIPNAFGYFSRETTTSERVLALLFLHAILSSGDSLTWKTQ
jgi:hypothetical protein